MSRTLRLTSYNIHSCIGGDRACNPERTLHVLREIDADVIALQEVGVGGTMDEADQFRYLERHLALPGVSGPNLRRRRTHFGNAVFVRGRILGADLVDLSVSPFEARGAIDCTLEIDGRRLRVIATHLGLFPHERRNQIRRLATVLNARSEHTTALLGDFNIFGPERRSLRQIGAPARLPRQRSFPARRPLVSLDRIWTVPNERLLRFHVHRTTLSRIASDHLPVVAEIELP